MAEIVFETREVIVQSGSYNYFPFYYNSDPSFDYNSLVVITYTGQLHDTSKSYSFVSIDLQDSPLDSPDSQEQDWAVVKTIQPYGKFYPYGTARGVVGIENPCGPHLRFRVYSTYGFFAMKWKVYFRNHG